MSSGHDQFSGRAARTDRSPSYDSVIATHYDVLGVTPDASADQIRAAYVERARTRHPDVVGADDPGPSDATAPAMSELNEAYHVLRRPQSRLDYDRALRADSRRSQQQPPAGDGRFDDDRFDDGDRDDEAIARSPGARIAGRVLAPAGPARMPWKLMAVAAAIGTVGVIASAALADPPETEPPDGILQVGSCVTIEPNGDAREVSCVDSPDLVVRRLLPTGSTCPPAYATHRDRLGLGTVCVESS